MLISYVQVVRISTIKLYAFRWTGRTNSGTLVFMGLKIEAFIKDMNEWIEMNGPNAVAKLSAGADVSTSTISKVRNGYTPRTSIIRELCRFMGLKVEAYMVSEKKKAG